MDSTQKVSQVFNSDPQGSRLVGWPKTEGAIMYKQTLINAKLQIGKDVKNRTDLGKSI
jgi:hypothetical protein